MANGGTPNLPGNPHSAGAAVGNAQHAIGQMVKNIKASQNRKVKTFRIKAAVIMSTIMSFDQFKDAFDETFVSSVCPNAIIQSKANSKPLILKSILWCDELCSALPQPSGDFYGALMNLKINGVPKKGKRQDVVKNQIKILENQLKANNSVKAKTDFNRLSRYPVGFCVMTDSQQLPSPLTAVTIEFQRDYDFSKCKILGFDIKA